MKKAVTLVEVMVVAVIVAALFLIISPYFRIIRENSASVDSKTEILQNGRVALDKIASELKTAQKIVSVTGSNDANGKIIYIDSSSSQAEFVKYGDTLGFVTGGATCELAGPVASLKFFAKKADGSTEAGVPALIRSIDVEFAVADRSKIIADQVFKTTVAIGKDIITGLNYALFSNGNIYLYGSGTINGSIHANGTVNPRNISVLPPDTITDSNSGFTLPFVSIDIKSYTSEADYFHPDGYNFNNASPPAGVHYVSGNTTVSRNNLLLNGSIIAEGDVDITGNNVSINASGNYPAILSGGNIYCDRTIKQIAGFIYSDGYAWVNGNITSISGEVAAKDYIRIDGSVNAFLYNPAVNITPPLYLSEAPPGSILTSPEVITLPATGVGFNFATLNMDYNFNDYLSGDLRFAYKRLQVSTWSYTAWESASGSGSYAKLLTGLSRSGNRRYEFYAQLRYNGTSIINGSALQFRLP